jgi:beta-glucosidase
MPDVTYRDRTRSIDERVDDLLSRMTLEEKVAQMLGIWREKADALVDAAGRFDEAKAKARFGEGHGRATPGAVAPRGRTPS